jgi:ABC-type lipoprotein release transport system permease subunit
MSWFGKAFMRVSLIPNWDYLEHFVIASLVIALLASAVPSWLVTRIEPTRLLREE